MLQCFKSNLQGAPLLGSLEHVMIFFINRYDNIIIILDVFNAR